jgi:hypothetical protein
MPVLKQAVVGGQYSYPLGLFFGGARLEQGAAKYRDFLSHSLRSAERVIAIDVHTGLGKYGEDLLLVSSEEYEHCRRVFGDRVTSSDPEKSAAYRIRGGLQDMVRDSVPTAEVIFATQEFGTYAPTKVLHALRDENRWHHYGNGSLDHRAKRRLKDIFCPADPAWRSSVLSRGEHALRQAVDYR